MSARLKPNREGETSAEPGGYENALPEGWANSIVATVIDDCQPGFASGDKNVEDGVSHLRMNNIGLLGELILDLVRTVPEKLAKPRHDLHVGDVLVCTTNSAKLVGKCALFNLEGRYAFSNHLTRLRPNRSVIDSSYLRWCLWSLWKAGTFDDKCKHWVNQSTIPKEALLEADIPLAPLAEQRRIVLKLDLLLGKVSSSRQRLSRVSGLLKRFRQSVLAAACSGKLTADWREQNNDLDAEAELRAVLAKAEQRRGTAEPTEGRELLTDAIPSSWQLPRIEEVFRIIDYRGRNPEKAAHGKRIITAKNIRMGYLSNEPVEFVSDETYAEWMTRGFPRKGDILFVTEGATMGFVALNTRDDEIALAQRTLTLQPFDDTLGTNAFFYFMMSKLFQDVVILNATGSAAVGIKGAKFRDLPIPFPPLSEQQEIVRRVEKLFAFADQIESRLKQAQAHFDRLTQSILAKAFRGQLVPQNPGDVPASVLLDKLRAERESMKRKTSKKVN
ncbi:MAG: restriction endonuclease subunit S [Pirellula sp.]|nr:restriction endonuclease subunit S [Pirellula sp.]